MKSRVLTLLLLGYLALLVYASLMPYDLDGGDSLAAQARRDRAFDCWPFRAVEHTSKADVLSNLLLYVPLGLLAAVYLQLNRRWPGAVAFLFATLLCAAVSFTVEWFQSYSATRTCSAQDFLMNTLGGGAGALAGAAVGRRWWERLAAYARARRRDNPLALAGAALVLVAAIDALYPFRPTIDVSQVWHAVKASAAGIGQGLAVHPWHHWLIARGGFWMVLTILLASGGTSGPARWWRGALLAGLLAASLELCKPFIEGRTANAANVATSLGGAVAGLVLGPIFFGRLPRAALAWCMALLTGAYIVYLELLPFAFTCEWPDIQKKMPHGAEWLPLFQYATHGGIDDVRMFAQNLLLAAVTVFAAGIGSPRQAAYRFEWVLKAVLVTGFVAVGLEMMQFLLPGRTPSVTDVFTIVLGGGIGAWLSAEAARETLLAQEHARRASVAASRGSHLR